MCDTYIQGIGYICTDCQQEFKNYLSSAGVTPQTDTEIERSLKNFMKTEKGQYSEGNRITVEEFFRNNTK